MNRKKIMMDSVKRAEKVTYLVNLCPVLDTISFDKCFPTKAVPAVENISKLIREIPPRPVLSAGH
jgi:hypothetical protein